VQAMGIPDALHQQLTQHWEPFEYVMHWGQK
jgi:hypothetical protein